MNNKDYHPLKNENFRQQLMTKDLEGLKIPRYRSFWAAYKSGFRNFCGDIETANRNKGIVVDRRTMDAAWVQCLVPLWESWDGAELGLDAEPDGRVKTRGMKAIYDAMFRQRFGKKMEEYWRKKGAANPGLDVSFIRDPEYELEPEPEWVTALNAAQDHREEVIDMADALTGVKLDTDGDVDMM